MITGHMCLPSGSEMQKQTLSAQDSAREVSKLSQEEGEGEGA